MPINTKMAAYLPAPSSLLEMEEWFGRPFTDPDFEDTYITRIPVTLSHGTQITIACHVAIAGRLERVFQALKRDSALPLVKTFDGCFNIRKVRGGSRPSLHAWGLAIDINAGEFPMGSQRCQNPVLVRAFMAAGFFSGAKFHRPDPMHFQYSANAM